MIELPEDASAGFYVNDQCACHLDRDGEEGEGPEFNYVYIFKHLKNYWLLLHLSGLFPACGKYVHLGENKVTFLCKRICGFKNYLLHIT